MNGLIRPTAITTALVVLLDQGSKSAVRDHMSVCPGPPVSSCERIALVGPVGLLRAENPDSAFGFLDGSSVAVLLLLALAIVASQAAIARPRIGSKAPSVVAVSIGLQLGGLLGNLLDRILNGRVTDFIDVRPSFVDPGLIFNPADVALAAGALLLASVVWSTASRASPSVTPDERTALPMRVAE